MKYRRSRQKSDTRKSTSSEILQTSYEESEEELVEETSGERMRLSERMKRKKHPGLQATEIGVTQGFLSRNMQNPKTAEAVAGSSLSNDSETPAVLEADDLLSEDLEPKKRAHEMTDGHSLINLNDETGKTPFGARLTRNY